MTETHDLRNQWYDEPVRYETPMTENEEEIEKVKAQIKVLEKKLSFLEELEKTKTPVEEAYKRVYGKYPVEEVSENLTAEDNWNVISWSAFQDGYIASQKDYKVGQYQETAQERGERIYKEMEAKKLQDKEWNVDVKTNLKPHWEPKPQTPEQVADGLKEAFREAVKQGVVSSVEKSKDDFMDKMVAELKGQTLTDLIWNWWGNVFTSNEEWDAENAIEHLVDLIEAFLPKSQSSAGSQNAYVECTVEGFNDCLNTIKRKLR